LGVFANLFLFSCISGLFLSTFQEQGHLKGFGFWKPFRSNAGFEGGCALKGW
jgi:hypothetical protein